MSRLIHFGNPSISIREKRVYYHSTAWTICRIHRNYIEGEIISSDYREITCEKCIVKMTCSHDWIFKFTGRHGSDKGDDHFECSKCSLRLQESVWKPKRQKEFAAEIWSNIDTENKKILIFSNFKFYEWLHPNEHIKQVSKYND